MQFSKHPSPLSVLPSSHCSGGSTVPFPQIGAAPKLLDEESDDRDDEEEREDPVPLATDDSEEDETELPVPLLMDESDELEIDTDEDVSDDELVPPFPPPPLLELLEVCEELDADSEDD